MKTKLLTLAASLAACFVSQADTVTLWDFNYPKTATVFPSGDENGTTGSFEPFIGNGRFNSMNVTSTTFGGTTASSDPWIGDNSALRLGGFPTASTANKTAGIQFFTSTEGYANIQISFDQSNSATASRYWRAQYTIDGGVNWVDHAVLVSAGNTAYINQRYVDLTGIPEVNNNPLFGFRYVSEFQSTATGSGTAGYVANNDGSNYGTGGTLWMDMVTVHGDDLDPSNQRPQISHFEDVIALSNDVIPPIPFIVGDAETTPGDLVVSATSSNPSLVSSFSIGGGGSDRTLTVTLQPDAHGEAFIRVRVTDAGGRPAQAIFALSVVHPEILPIAAQSGSWNVPLAVPFTVTNLPGDPASWVITATSSNESVVPNSGITVEGTTATISALTIGQSVVTITVTSGDRQITRSFDFEALPESVVAYNLSSIPNAIVESVAPTTVIAGLTATDLIRGPTLGGFNLTRGFSATNWNNPGIGIEPTRENALYGDYFEFTVTVQPGYTASLAMLDVSLRRSAVNAAMNFEWLYSFDGFSTPGTTIVPRGPIWDMLGWAENHFTYLARSAAGTVGSPANYAYMLTRVDGQDAGNPMPRIDLSLMPGLQNIPGGTTITFRLIGWGNDQTTAGNTVAMGRDHGPHIRGAVFLGSAPAVLVVGRSGNNIQISWPSSVSGTLESTSALGGSWSDVVQTPTENGGNKTVTIPASGNQQFFRLRQ